MNGLSTSFSVLTARRPRGDVHRVLGMPRFQRFYPIISAKLCAFRYFFAAMSAYPEYSLDDTIAVFFSQTSASRELCDTKAKDLVGGDVVPVTVQGNCSYSVYAGPEFEFFVQFRLKSLVLKSKIVTLAREIYSSLAPNASFHRQFGEDGKEHYMSRL